MKDREKYWREEEIERERETESRKGVRGREGKEASSRNGWRGREK